MVQHQIQAKEKKELEREQTRAGRYYVPDVDIVETEDGLWLYADIPGAADTERVGVELQEDTLTIQAEVDLKPYEGLKPLYTEYNVGHFLRRFVVPDGSRFDRDGIKAQLRNGVLTVHLPRAAASKPRRIQVQAG